MKNMRLPAALQAEMAQEAEATRRARARMIMSEGEKQAAEQLTRAADLISQSPAAIQLRYLQVTSCILI